MSGPDTVSVTTLDGGGQPSTSIGFNLLVSCSAG
jgi:hypothetical protein